MYSFLIRFFGPGQKAVWQFIHWSTIVLNRKTDSESCASNWRAASNYELAKAVYSAVFIVESVGIAE